MSGGAAAWHPQELYRRSFRCGMSRGCKTALRAGGIRLVCETTHQNPISRAEKFCGGTLGRQLGGMQASGPREPEPLPLVVVGRPLWEGGGSLATPVRHLRLVALAAWVARRAALVAIFAQRAYAKSLRGLLPVNADQAKNDEATRAHERPTHAPTPGHRSR